MKKSKKQKSGLDFEIEFFEKLIKEKDNFVDVLIPLAENYTKAGRYEEGLAIDEQLSSLKSEDPIVHYNLACSYSLLNRVDEAIIALKKAIDFGYNDFEFMNLDSDLSSLRKDKRFQELISNLAKRKRS